MKKALSAGFGPARKFVGAGSDSVGGAGSEGEREREWTAGAVAEKGEEGEGSTIAGAEESVASEGTEKETEDGGGSGQEVTRAISRTTLPPLDSLP
ncbi:hypothetical protein B9Z19DRAFT_1128335 [Tuber borchii]|uniref:Uncharacterized protein n=1 Tax=Tuber borchii TaxID=42251 RepID=A0A2T6ZPN2_TUBBO|nr:hypothetical protein B9Z19DRAFT_1128335 [Tuber borchii]